MAARKLILVDGNSLLYRAFFALPAELATTAGVPTNAVYGFATMLVRLLLDERPDCILVAWERGETFRHAEFAEYKSGRPPTPDALSVQAPMARAVQEALRIPSVEVPGFEADDVVATLARRGAEQGYDVLIVTGDQDLLQLVDDRVHVLLMRRGIREVARYDVAAVRAHFGIEPSQFPDYKALKGDPSDNLPGVPGIGDRTAASLLARFGSLEAILARLDEVTPPRIRAALQQHAAATRRYRALATLVSDVPISLDLDTCRYSGPDPVRTREVFEQLQFRSLLQRLLRAGGEETAPAATICAPTSEAELARRLAALAPDRLGIAVLPTGRAGHDCQAVAVALAAGEDVLCIGDPRATAPLAALPEAVRDRLADPGASLAGHALKGTLHCLANLGVERREWGFDSELAAYLLYPGRSAYRLEEIAREYLGVAPPHSGEPAARLAWEAQTALRLWPRLLQALEEDALDRLYFEIELPLVPVLAAMERAGIHLDLAALADLSERLARRLAATQEQIYAIAGHPFNIGSPRQLQQVLFTELGLPATRRTKTGYSTSVEVLQELAVVHPLPAKILEYRELARLKSAYADALPTLIHPVTGRVHTTFHQTVTATGRLSSSDPNLQNIPIRTELGREVRRAFLPAPGWQLLSADYSQIELRILAHVTGDPELLAAFRSGEDIHTTTASRIFDVPPDRVTADLRRRGKTLNYAVIYGMGDYGLSRELGIPLAQARNLIEAYFRRFPGVRRYTEQTLREARQRGYVTTLPPYCRRRYLPGIQSSNRTERTLAERAAVNAPIQGTAADIIKAAMLRLDRALREQRLPARLLLQVHDELVVEAPPAALPQVAAAMREAMCGARDLAVPLEVDVRAGPNWLDLTPVA